MKKIVLYLFLFQSMILFSQNSEEIEADYEMQGYFKNYQEFNLDTLKKKKFKHILGINTIRGGFEFDRMLDYNLKHSIYTIIVDFPLENKNYRYIEYKVHVFSKNDVIIGLINYNTFRKKTNSYFDYEKMLVHMDSHNDFYETELEISDFVSQLEKLEIYGYACGLMADLGKPLEHNEIYFSDIRNAEIFRTWLKSFSPELQSFGVDALEFLEENEKLPLSPHEKKIIQHIKLRNSVLYACGGCIVSPRKIYKK